MDLKKNCIFANYLSAKIAPFDWNNTFTEKK